MQWFWNRNSNLLNMEMNIFRRIFIGQAIYRAIVEGIWLSNLKEVVVILFWLFFCPLCQKRRGGFCFFLKSIRNSV